VGVRGVGFFPNARRPKVIWVGVDDPEKCIAPLHRAIEGGLARLGFEKSNEPLVPHITVARVKEVPPGDALAEAVDPLVNSRFGWSQAVGVDFFESELRPEGPTYRLVSKHPFLGGKVTH
jgi:2'-5' RNA ligase